VKVHCPCQAVSVYSCNSYLVQGDWNRLEDVNALVDAGPNPYLVTQIDAAHTGLGKVRLERIVLTHGHSDHTAGIAQLKARYGATVWAFAASAGVDRVLADGERLRLGDRDVEVIHAPVHSSDSICLYSAEDGALFSGDTPLSIVTPSGSHDEGFVALLERLLSLDLRTIYPGHGEPVLCGAARMLRETLRNVETSVNHCRSDRQCTATAPWALEPAGC
jgi:glyoxylase-like metal-dependent hydrolase (beta-lactamase superfamily II)